MFYQNQNLLNYSDVFYVWNCYKIIIKDIENPLLRNIF